MEWEHVEWKIKTLLDLYDKGKINLSPDYQRNPIWTSKAQKLLIDTILAPQPMPNFFLLKKTDDEYEMVDGQQRSRSIIDFRNSKITSSNKVKFEDSKNEFINYELNITLITNLSEHEKIENFYTLVNSTGLRLNSPELRKAKNFETKFYDLCTEMASLDAFTQLELFSSSTTERMNDIELVAELLTLLLMGYSEKKDEVEKLFDEDISDLQEKKLRNKFINIVDILTILDHIQPLNKTRYKQRADLYTLFDFISQNFDMSKDDLTHCYRIMLAIAPHIRPTQEDCIPLRDYARNCVSQSNSKKARQERSQFLFDLMKNPDPTPNSTQNAIIAFLKIKHELIKIHNAWAINISSIEEKI